MDKYDCIRIENQICFPLYACSKEMTRRYKGVLDEFGLTYTQYIAMMVMWEKKKSNVKELGEILYLDSGTLTPVLKKLESKGYIVRNRCHDDERCVMIELTDDGTKLREDAVRVQEKMKCAAELSEEEADQLYTLLYKLLKKIKNIQED